ncbi:MAG: metallopeptidase family protein [Rhodospirillales bacterium]
MVPNRGRPLHIVLHVLIHEIGHHFGFSDADIESIERWGWGPFTKTFIKRNQRSF